MDAVLDLTELVDGVSSSNVSVRPLREDVLVGRVECDGEDGGWFNLLTNSLGGFLGLGGGRSGMERQRV